MELILIRHALPLRVENEDGRPADPPLSETGRAQADRLVRWLADEPLDTLYTSPLRRALETAQPLSESRGLELRIEPGVAEIDQQAPTYVPLEEMKADDPEGWRELMRRGLYENADLQRFHAVVTASLARIIADHPGERVAVVCHGGVINVFAADVLGLAPRLFFDPTYTSINRFAAARSGERSVRTLGEAAHLR